MTHKKKKKGQPVRYTETTTVQNKAGKRFKVVKGTQKVDGYWATLRRNVGKRAVNTGAAGTAKREWLCKLVRVHQWLHWGLGKDCFMQLGALYRKRREDAFAF